MHRKLVPGVLLLLAAAVSFAGGASGQFGVQITLKNNNSDNNICTSATGSGAGSASVQVRCTTNVFVNIVQVKAQEIGRFMPGFRPVRDSLLPDFCRNELSRTDQTARITCRLDDQRVASADDETDDGWKIESRLYAIDTDAAVAQTQARLRFQDDRGTLTALRVAHAGRHSGSVEMLVSF